MAAWVFRIQQRQEEIFPPAQFSMDGVICRFMDIKANTVGYARLAAATDRHRKCTTTCPFDGSRLNNLTSIAQRREGHQLNEIQLIPAGLATFLSVIWPY